ncbi:collagen-like protein, partial [Lacticaseibacillus paracasei subsp. paracasei]
KIISRPAAFGNTQPTDTTEHVSQTITTASTTAYMRVSFRKHNDFKAKLEKGSIATDWSLNPSEILTQSDYAKIKAAIVALGGSLS